MTEQELQEIKNNLEKVRIEWGFNVPANIDRSLDDIPKLLDEVERLRKALEEIRETYKAEGYGPFIDEIARKALEGGTE